MTTTGQARCPRDFAICCAAIARTERLGLSFGGERRPLLVYMLGRGGNHAGMLDTVLNVGLNDAMRPAVRMTGNPRFA